MLTRTGGPPLPARFADVPQPATATVAASTNSSGEAPRVARSGYRRAPPASASAARVARGDDRRLLDRTAGLDRPREPHVLGVRPRQRRRREGPLAGREPGLTAGG